MSIRKWVMTALVAAHLRGELYHASHAHAEPTAPHAPEESPSSGPNLSIIEAGLGTGTGGLTTGRTLELRTGCVPNGKLDPDSGLLLASLPAYIPDVSDGSESVWAEGDAEASGTAQHFRVKDADGRVVFQGNITAPDGDGELKVDNNSVVASGFVYITLRRDA